MKTIINVLFTVSVMLLSCREPTVTEQFVSTLPLRLKARTDVRPTNYTNKEVTALYSYDSLNRVVRIDRDWIDRNVIYQYQNGRLVTRLTQSTQDGRIFFRDTLAYSPNGQMIRKTAVQNGSSSVYEYRYNNAGQIVEVEQRATGYRYYNLTRYVWQNGNIVFRTEYDLNETKKSDWSYQYDRNANPFRLSPYNPDDPFQFTANNRTVERLDRDYTGLIDLIANPILFAYTYNSDRLPTDVTINYGLIQRFEYEPKR